MAQADQPARERAILKFSVEGLPAREELLFKSYMRLLGHATLHAWLYSAHPRNVRINVRVDLRIVAEGLDVTLIPQAQHVLTLGTIDRRRDDYLCLPVRADELEQALNRLGALILSSRFISTPLRQTEQTIIGAHGLFNSSESVRLLRWPPVALLGSPGRMRLATLMTGQPMTLTALQQRSGLPAQVCIEFVNDLKRAGFVGCLPTTVPVQRPIVKAGSAPEVQRSLLERIRARLGLQPGGRS